LKPAARGNWSIAERATIWFAGTTGVVVLGIAGYASWEVSHSKDNELIEIATERLAQLRTRFDPAEELEGAGHAGEAFLQRREEFARLVNAIRMQGRDDNPLAVRVIDAATGEVLGDFGDVALVPGNLRMSEELQFFDGHMLARGERLGTDIHAVMVVDGAHQREESRRFALTAFALALVSGFAAYFSGRFFIHRACEYMAELARRTREVRYSTEQVSIEPGSVPSEIAELVQALEHMLANIRVEEERTRLLARGLAHELGSPLQNLIGETEVALMGPSDPAEYRRVLESHLEELRDIGHAVGNLMTLVSQRGRDAAPGDERFDLGIEAGIRLGRERAHAQRGGIDLKVEQRGDLTLEGDREALWLVVSNLVANAIDYTPRGGHVRLQLLGEGPVVRVCVDDSGPGIPEAERELVFEPFRRGSTRKGRRAGYGLGLSIVRGAVDSQGGSVSISTSEFSGARFVVELPRQRA
jgi:two-component system heavy metal sensor histidine kinase CusS